MDAVALSVNVRSTFGNVESSDVGLIGPTSGVRDGVELPDEVAEVVLVVVAGWEGLAEHVTGHADERRTIRDRISKVGKFLGS